MSSTLSLPHMHTRKCANRIYRAREWRKARERMLSRRYMEGDGMYRWRREVQREVATCGLHDATCPDPDRQWRPAGTTRRASYS